MASVPQDPHWHPEGDVLTHSLLSADAAAAICDNLGIAGDRREVLVLAALLHDVGKPATTRFNSGRIVSPGHAEVGEQLIVRLGADFNWPNKFTDVIAVLVRHHMAHLSVVGDPTRRAVARLHSRLEAAGTSIEDWSIVVQADGAARGNPSAGNRAEPWTRVLSESKLT
jgi:tRNA nucleotidyltransferase (CCA-adding enzyme)